MCGESCRGGAPRAARRSQVAARPDPPVWLSLLAAVVIPTAASAQLAVTRVEVAPRTAQSRVPAVTAQGRTLAPQAVSAVDISHDGKFITVGTMAFSHDANVWQFAPDGTVLAKRHFPPWAPMQVATLDGGKAMAVGLAYSRVTSPEPTVWFGPTSALFDATLKPEFAEADTRDSELARLRPGEGEWRTGWVASHLGELFVRGPDWVFKPPGTLMSADGQRIRLRYEDKNQLPTSRATRMASSRDGKRAAFGWLALKRPADGLRPLPHALTVWGVNPNRPLWSARPSDDLPLPPLPTPAVDFPELAKDGFRLNADTVAPGTVTAAVGLSTDGSRVALVEYAVQVWTRTGPAIGKWDPPIHALNFVPKQRGRLRVFDGEGKELLREWLPEAGLFEVGFGDKADEVWCWPASWFARGMAGEPWLPVNVANVGAEAAKPTAGAALPLFPTREERAGERRGVNPIVKAPLPGPLPAAQGEGVGARVASTVYRVNITTRAAEALVFPDAVADCALNPTDGRALVSCWDGQAFLANADGKVSGKWELGSPARLAWSADGSFAIAGTADGKLIRVERDGKLAWKQSMTVGQPPTIATPPAEVVAGTPVHQGGRVPQGEHAYVGDIWVLKLGREAVLVDAGGTSGFALSQARVKALGVERVTHVLHTHSHGDHCGGAYLWRAAGAKIVGPKSAALTLTWLMPMLTDYGIYPPRPLDVPLPLARVGDVTEFEVSGQKFRAFFVPGHSFDLTVYMTELGGKRVAFTGDLGFERESDIVHRCWGDADKARPVVKAIRETLLAWKPDVVFTGHGVRPNGTEWVEDLLKRSEESLAKLEKK